MAASRCGFVRSPTRRPPRLTTMVGKFDQRLRCASSLKSEDDLVAQGIIERAKESFAAAAISAVALPVADGGALAHALCGFAQRRHATAMVSFRQI